MTAKKDNHRQPAAATPEPSAAAGLAPQPYPPQLAPLPGPQSEPEWLQFMQTIKALNAESKVIILSHHELLDSTMTALNRGADQYLLQPCAREEILAKINRCLAEKRPSPAPTDQEEWNALVAELTRTREELRQLHGAWQYLLKTREEDRQTLRQQITAQIMATVIPLLTRAKNKSLGLAKSYLQGAEANLMELLTDNPLSARLHKAQLSPRERQVVALLRQNKSTRQIADLMELSVRSVEALRNSIRNKIGIKNKSTNLKKLVASLP